RRFRMPGGRTLHFEAIPLEDLGETIKSGTRLTGPARRRDKALGGLEEAVAVDGVQDAFVWCRHVHSLTRRCLQSINNQVSPASKHIIAPPHNKPSQP